MLELRTIKKDYLAGENKVHALKGISLKFRRNEFVSILGPSGCGKTTMLNIIGGLDQYTSGDLLINGRSTKNYKDRDWDTYRNHSIGFVFQSYNLIPHQTVLRNVELALTLSGVSKTERKQRAIQALNDVGLGNQLHKKPGEMSGGQMQRVAIARALVNNPDIILADEPTGALDTETSVQVMEILKKISRDRLIIMVTHNPELAETYSTRIIRMLDGEIQSDSAPLSQKEIQSETINAKSAEEREKKLKRPSMSMKTAYALSLNNLLTKKGRTFLTSFAGSIGIIGIALILSISQGLTAYIDAIQEETLSSYPLTIQRTEVDMNSLMETFMGITKEGNSHERDAVYTNRVLYDMMNAMNNLETTENDLKSFKEYLDQELQNEREGNVLYDAVNGIQYGYDLDLQVYTKNADNMIIKSDIEELLTELAMEYMDIDMSSMMDMQEENVLSDSNPMMSQMSGGMKLWQELLPGRYGEPVSDVLKKQYDVVYGNWPEKYNEIVLVLDENYELDDMTLYSLGLVSKESAGNIVEAALEQKELEYKEQKWSYEEMCDMEFRVVLNSDCFSYDENSGLYIDLRESEAGLKYLYDYGIPLKVTGIICPNEDVTAPMLTGTIGYTNGLTNHVIGQMKESDVMQAQLADEHTDIFTGLPFKETAGNLTVEEKAEEWKRYLVNLDDSMKAGLYTEMKGIIPKEQLDSMLNEAMSGMTRVSMEEILFQGLTAQMGMSEHDIGEYLKAMDDEEVTEIVAQMLTEQMKQQYASEVKQRLSSMSPEELSAALDKEQEMLSDEQCAVYYDEIMTFSENSYDKNLREMGYLDLNNPSTMNIYASTFEKKDLIEEAIGDYNESRDELSQIKYTDYVGIMMSSVSTIINAITYVLVAFVAISLIVSSIMIGVITLISVQERTKEIGILRAIGASKKNVSSMFTAETVIIGLASGLLGVLVTTVLCKPINMIIHHLTGIENLNAYLPVEAALILIGISILLNFISGVIPSKSAAKKDPVVALRTE